MAAMLNIIHTRTTDHKLSKNNKAIKIVKRFTWIWHCINYITHYLLKGRASAHKTHSENIRLKTSVVRDIWWQHTSSGVPVTRCTFNTWFTAVGTVHTNKDLPNTAHNDALTQLRHIRIYKVAPENQCNLLHACEFHLFLSHPVQRWTQKHLYCILLHCATGWRKKCTRSASRRCWF